MTGAYPHDRDREPSAPWDVELDLDVERQNGPNWCWAAVAKGIVEYYGGPVRRQCEYATYFLGQTATCCGAETQPRCDAPYPIDEVLRHHDVFAPPSFRRAVSLETLRRELERDRPVVALIAYATGFHAVAIRAVNVRERLIGFADSLSRTGRSRSDAAAFGGAYASTGRWSHTILTRPPGAAPNVPLVSLLRDRMPRERFVSAEPANAAGGPVTLPFYEADLARLADGTGISTAEPRPQYDYAWTGLDARTWTWLEEGLDQLREEILARIAAGYDVRLLQCFAVKLTALWFLKSREASRRGDHYLLVPPVAAYAEAGREYTASELSAAVQDAARNQLAHAPAIGAWFARLDRESVEPERSS